MKELFTWHRGSILPYTSLWHVVRRVISLNSLNSQQIPLADEKSRPTNAEVVFNDLNAEIDIGVLSSLLGEDSAAFDWSTFSRLNKSWRFLVDPNLKVCKDCLNQGFHSTFFSLRLLAVCPIHQTKLSSTCRCGRIFPARISPSYFQTPHCCTCGGTLFFSEETCRRPSLSAYETAVFNPISEWLSEISKCLRPDFGKAEEMKLYETHWLESAERWSEHLKLRYPESFQRSPGSSMTRATASYSGRLRNLSPKSADACCIQRQHWDLLLFRNEEPSLSTYRAMSRYIRQHVCRRADYWIKKFVRSRDALEIGEFLNVSDEAKIAFTEMLWAQHVEPTAQYRRWPYRNPEAPAKSRIGCWFFAKGVWVACGNVLESHTKHWESTRNWIEYQSTGAYLMAVWRAAWAHTERCALSCIADWRVTELSVQAQMSWISSFDPCDSTRSLFILDADLGGRLPVLSHTSKDERRARARDLAHAGSLLVANVCKGPCLTWTEKDGFHVGEGATPLTGYRKHRVILTKGTHPRAWLFVAHGKYVLRLIDTRLQVFGETPREVFEVMRHCVLKYLASNTHAFSFPRRQRPIVTADRPRNPRRVDYQIAVYKDTKRMGFFEAANIARIYAQWYVEGRMRFDKTYWEGQPERIVLFRELL